MTYASVMGFREDNNLDVDKYGWLGGIFCAFPDFVAVADTQTSDTSLVHTP